MIKNNINVAVRNILKNKLFAAINIIGLAIGLAIFVFAQLFAGYERSHDAFFPNVERMFAVYTHIRPEANLGTQLLNSSQTRVAPLMKSEVTEMEYVARLMSREYMANTGDRKFYQSIRFADPEFLEIFQFDYVQGNAAQALSEPSGLIITESTAIKYFGNNNPLGQVITFRNQYDLRVTAVIRDLPLNSHLRTSIIEDASFEMVAGMGALANMSNFNIDGDWDNLSTRDKTYASLRTGANIITANEQLQGLYASHMPEDQKESFSGFTLRPVTDLNTWIWEAMGFPVITSIQILGLLVLLVACLNYINLATAQVMGRTREVGMRKTLGATKTQLFTQFITESVLLTAGALVIAMAIIKLSLPMVNTAMNKSLSFSHLSAFELIGGLLVTIIGVGLLAGSYPAYLIAKGKVVMMLSGEMQGGRKGALLRNIMLVVQFSISIFMMIAVAIIFAQNKMVAESGDIFSKDQVVVLDRISRPEIRELSETLRSELLRVPGVSSVAYSSQVPFEQNHSAQDYSAMPGNAADKVNLYSFRVDEDFLGVYGTQMMAGRGLSLDYAADTLVDNDEGIPTSTSVNVVVNEMAAGRLGYENPSEALGKSFHRTDEETAFLEYRIVGVVTDVNYLGFFNDMKPIIFIRRPQSFRLASVLISADAIPATLEGIDAAWEKVVPAYPIQRRLLADVFDDVFNIFTNINKALAAFAGLALLVALIGLFGLAAFMTELRTREMGIRKVMGASGPRIVLHLIWQFSKPVFIAIALAAPLGWLAAGAYLDFFAERVGLSPMFFIPSGLAVIVVAALIVSFHALRVSRVNPVIALRYE